MLNSIHDIPANARIWVYQSNRFFTDAEVKSILESGSNFIQNWSAHGASLKASFEVLYNLFIVIAVDEQQAMASGCSIDKSVGFVKELEQKFNCNLLDRMQVAYKLGNEIKNCTLSQFEKLAAQNIVDENTIVFNNMVTTKAAFDNEWQIPLKNSWQKRVLVSV